MSNIYKQTKLRTRHSPFGPPQLLAYMVERGRRADDVFETIDSFSRRIYIIIRRTQRDIERQTGAQRSALCERIVACTVDVQDTAWTSVLDDRHVSMSTPSSHAHHKNTCTVPTYLPTYLPSYMYSVSRICHSWSVSQMDQLSFIDRTSRDIYE